MDHLRRQVRRARRRLILQSFGGKLAWCWFAAFVLAALAIGGGKIWPPGDPRAWELGALAAALLAGTVAAAVWTWLGVPSALEAALEIDHRHGLKERVSSVLALDRQRLQSDAGQALLQDAAARLETIDVAGQFGLRPDRRAWLPLPPAALAVGLALFVNARATEAPVAAAAETAQIKKSAQVLAKKIDETRKEAQEQGLTDVDALLKQLSHFTE